MGCDIVAKSLRAPVRLIASNAGVEGDVIIEKLLGKPFEIGYNAVRHAGVFLGKPFEIGYNAVRAPVGVRVLNVMRMWVGKQGSCPGKCPAKELLPCPALCGWCTWHAEHPSCVERASARLELPTGLLHSLRSLPKLDLWFFFWVVCTV